VTLTFRSPVYHRWQALSRLRGYIAQLQRHTSEQIDWAGVTEVGISGSFHLHALLLGTAHLSIGQMRGLWSSGHSMITRYDARKSATHYLAKHVGKGETEIDLSDNLPKRRLQV
jgi:hypothetical protein